MFSGHLRYARSFGFEPRALMRPDSIFFVKPVPGMQITPKLTLTSLLGGGGMGSIWLGAHAGLDVAVVVKFLSEELANNPEALARFRKEASASSQVKSPHVVQVFDHGVTEAGVPYIVMEHLEGCDLRKALQQHGSFTPFEVVEIVRQIARALTRAHAVGVVHRDLKPENIFLCETGDGEAFIKILDFGVAKVQDKLSPKTISGAVLGTPFYMSPEQILGYSIDGSTDLWALGVVAFEALTGKRPFEGETIGAVTLAIHTTQPTPRTHRPLLPAALDAWFARALAKERERRFTSPKEMADAFAECVTGAPSVPGTLTFRAPLPSAAAPELSAMEATQLESSQAVLPAKRDPKVWPWLALTMGLLMVGGATGFVMLPKAPRVEPPRVLSAEPSRPSAPSTGDIPTDLPATFDEAIFDELDAAPSPHPKVRRPTFVVKSGASGKASNAPPVATKPYGDIR